MSPTFQRPAAVFGFTLIELMVALAVTGVVLALSIPTFETFLQRRRVEGLSAQLVNDLQFARAATLARSDALRLAFPTLAAGSGYLIHTGAAGTCTCRGEQPQCSTPADLLRGVCLAAEASVQVHANVSALLVDPRQGTVSPTGSIEVDSPQGGALRHIVNIMGRTRLCAVRGRFAGVPVC